MEHFTTVFELLTGSTQVDILIFRLQESVEKYHRSSVVKYFIEESFGTGVRTPKYRSLYKGPRYLFRKFQFMFLSNLEVNQLIYLSSRSLDCEKNDSRAQKIMRKNTIF